MKFKKYYIYFILIIIIICIYLFILKKNKKELFEVRYIEDGISTAIDINDVDLDDYDVHNTHIFPPNFRPHIQEILDSDDTNILDCEGTYEPCSPPCGSNSIQRSNNDDCPIKTCKYSKCDRDNQEHEEYCKYSEGTIEVGDCSVDCDYGVKPIINKPKNENCDDIVNYEYCFEKHCPINCDGKWSEDYLLKSKTQDFQNQDLSVVGNNSDLIRVKVWEGETEGKYGGNCNTLTDINGKFNYNNTWYRYQDYDQPHDCDGKWNEDCTKINDSENVNDNSEFIKANKWEGETQGTHDGACDNLNDITNKFTYDNNYYKLGNCPQPVDCQGEWGDCENGILNGINSNFKTYNITRERQNDGKICDFSNGETKTDGCNQPVDCDYEWGDWEECSKLCDTGTQQQTLNINQESLYNGIACPTNMVNTRNCNTESCNENTPGCNYTEWVKVGNCSKSCGGGKLMQKKTSNNGCTELTRNINCNTQPCPINCVLSNWSNWGDCSETCGGGIESRTKTIITQPQYGGNACGPRKDERSCNTHSCGPTITGDHTSNIYSKNNINYISYKYMGNGTLIPTTDINDVEILVIAGGGGGSGGRNGSHEGAGAGAGSLSYFKNISLKSNTHYNIVVGKGGNRGTNNTHATNGEDSYFKDNNEKEIKIICRGGGGGAKNKNNSGQMGGSGGGARHYGGRSGSRHFHTGGFVGGTFLWNLWENGIEPYPYRPGKNSGTTSDMQQYTNSNNNVNQQGHFGHIGGGGTNCSKSSGGGGAGGNGSCFSNNGSLCGRGGHGGKGKKYDLEDGTIKWYAGGGGAGRFCGKGGSDVGGNGSDGYQDHITYANAPNAGEPGGAKQNTGSGGGGGYGNNIGNGGSGADGVVIIRYPVQ